MFTYRTAAVIACLYCVSSVRNVASAARVQHTTSAARVQNRKAIDESGMVRDPFDPIRVGSEISFNAAPGNGCGLTGWKGSYLSVGVVVVAKLEFGLSTTTLEGDNDFAALLKTMGINTTEIFGTHSTEDFRFRMCAPKMLFVVPNACAFFDLANLALVCPVLAPGRFATIGQALGQAATHVTGQITSAMPNVIRDPLYPSQVGAMHGIIDAGKGNGCGVTGWTGSYFSHGIILVAKLEIGQSTTTLTSQSGDVAALLKQLGISDQIWGTHTTEDFRAMMCAPEVALVFPNACGFFAPANLALVCPVLAPGQAFTSLQKLPHQLGNLFNRP